MTTSSKLQGVIAAIATAVDATGDPDCARSAALARFLLAHGCDGLNVLGTTGEATSFSLEQRKRVMTAYRDAGLPLDRLMVGTGAASVADAIALTRHAAELGFAGALVLPPFYYKGVSDDGLVAYVEAIVTATAAKPIPIYLYHFPAQSGLPWHVRLVKRLIEAFGTRIVGLKDSSGDMAADVALNMELREAYPFCRLSGPANVLIMPAFHSASISTKLLQELGGATVIGPILVGLDRSVQIVPLSANDAQLVNMAALAAFNVSG